MWALARILLGTGSLITMHRWTARFLLLVMLVPAFGPLALARVGAPAGMHCMRRPLAAEQDRAAEPAMHCHHSAVQSAGQSAPQAAESQTSAAAPAASLRSLDCCCGQHCDCCRNSKTSEWARPAATHLSVISVLIEPAPAAHFVTRPATLFTGPDSARAPPRR